MKFATFFGTVAAALIGFVAGAVTVQMVAPDLLNPSRFQELPEALTARLESAGDFQNIDTIHKSSGRAQILVGEDITILRFTDFSVTNGPDLAVWLVRAAGVSNSEDIRVVDRLSLGPLKRPEGDQVYVIPDGVDPTEFRTVAIWDEQFGVLYGAAYLER